MTFKYNCHESHEKKLCTYLFLLQYIFFEKIFESKTVNNKFIPILSFKKKY